MKYEGFPYKLEHKDGKDGKDKKTCYFQCEDHVNKYIARAGFKPKDYKLEFDGVEVVGKSTRRKSTQKRSSSRQSSSN